jgi:hypothetical protein
MLHPSSFKKRVDNLSRLPYKERRLRCKRKIRIGWRTLFPTGFFASFGPIHKQKGGIKIMKRGFMIIVLALTFALSAQFVNTAGPTYSAHLLTPTAGQVVYPGQVVRVEWTSVLPKVNFFDSCETEVRMSVDGGRTFLYRISPWLTGRAHSFNWTVPNLPTNAAVLDIRFGCEPLYPESSAPQPGSTFVIARSGDDKPQR